MSARCQPLQRMAMVLLLTWLMTPVLAQERIRFGVYENPPLSHIDAEAGPTGFIIELFRHIARQRQWQLEFVPCSFEDCLERLKQGDIDLLSTIAYSRQRAEALQFTKRPLFVNWGRP